MRDDRAPGEGGDLDRPRRPTCTSPSGTPPLEAEGCETDGVDIVGIWRRVVARGEAKNAPRPRLWRACSIYFAVLCLLSVAGGVAGLHRNTASGVIQFVLGGLFFLNVLLTRWRWHRDLARQTEASASSG